MRRCSHPIGKNRCVRLSEEGNLCYQHKTDSILRKKPDNRARMEFPEMYSLFSSFLDEKDTKNLLVSLPKGNDPNKIILHRLKEGNVTFPFSLFVDGKLRVFDDLKEAREFVLKKYKQDIYPSLVKAIRKNGTGQKGTEPVNYYNQPDPNIPYGFRYFPGKSLLKDTPGVPTVEISFKFPDREVADDIDRTDEEMYEDYDNILTMDADLLTEYIKTIPLLPLVLKRGDVIFNNQYGGERNSGRTLWDGKKVVPLSYGFDDDGFVPEQFQTLTEFPFGYFQGAEGYMGIYSSNYWMDLSSYAEEAKKNFLNRESFIDVKEMVDGKERTIRIKLETEEKLSAEDFKQILLEKRVFVDLLRWGSDQRSITLFPSGDDEENDQENQ